MNCLLVLLGFALLATVLPEELVTDEDNIVWQHMYQHAHRFDEPLARRKREVTSSSLTADKSGRRRRAPFKRRAKREGEVPALDGDSDSHTVMEHILRKRNEAAADDDHNYVAKRLLIAEKQLDLNAYLCGIAKNREAIGLEGGESLTYKSDEHLVAKRSSNHDGNLSPARNKRNAPLIPSPQLLPDQGNNRFGPQLMGHTDQYYYSSHYDPFGNGAADYLDDDPEQCTRVSQKLSSSELDSSSNNIPSGSSSINSICKEEDESDRIRKISLFKNVLKKRPMVKNILNKDYRMRDTLSKGKEATIKSLTANTNKKFLNGEIEVEEEISDDSLPEKPEKESVSEKSPSRKFVTKKLLRQLVKKEFQNDLKGFFLAENVPKEILSKAHYSNEYTQKKILPEKVSSLKGHAYSKGYSAHSKLHSSNEYILKKIPSPKGTPHTEYVSMEDYSPKEELPTSLNFPAKETSSKKYSSIKNKSFKEYSSKTFPSSKERLLTKILSAGESLNKKLTSPKEHIYKGVHPKTHLSKECLPKKHTNIQYPDIDTYSFKYSSKSLPPKALLQPSKKYPSVQFSLGKEPPNKKYTSSKKYCFKESGHKNYHPKQFPLRPYSSRNYTQKEFPLAKQYPKVKYVSTNHHSPKEYTSINHLPKKTYSKTYLSVDNLPKEHFLAQESPPSTDDSFGKGQYQKHPFKTYSEEFHPKGLPFIQNSINNEQASVNNVFHKTHFPQENFKTYYLKEYPQQELLNEVHSPADSSFTSDYPHEEVLKTFSSEESPLTMEPLNSQYISTGSSSPYLPKTDYSTEYLSRELPSPLTETFANKEFVSPNNTFHNECYLKDYPSKEFPVTQESPNREYVSLDNSFYKEYPLKQIPQTYYTEELPRTEVSFTQQSPIKENFFYKEYSGEYIPKESSSVNDFISKDYTTEMYSHKEQSPQEAILDIYSTKTYSPIQPYTIKEFQDKKYCSKGNYPMKYPPEQIPIETYPLTENHKTEPLKNYYSTKYPLKGFSSKLYSSENYTPKESLLTIGPTTKDCTSIKGSPSTSPASNEYSPKKLPPVKDPSINEYPTTINYSPKECSTKNGLIKKPPTKELSPKYSPKSYPSKVKNVTGKYPAPANMKSKPYNMTMKTTPPLTLNISNSQAICNSTLPQKTNSSSSKSCSTKSSNDSLQNYTSTCSSPNSTDTTSACSLSDGSSDFSIDSFDKDSSCDTSDDSLYKESICDYPTDPCQPSKVCTCSKPSKTPPITPSCESKSSKKHPLFCSKKAPHVHIEKNSETSGNSNGHVMFSHLEPSLKNCNGSDGSKQGLLKTEWDKFTSWLDKTCSKFTKKKQKSDCLESTTEMANRGDTSTCGCCGKMYSTTEGRGDKRNRIRMCQKT